MTYAASHGGVITTAEALALGMTRRMITNRVTNGVLVRVRQGVLSLPGSPTSENVDLEAACRKLGGVVSHESAGRLHQFVGIPPRDPTITVQHRGSNRLPGVVIHQSTDLTDVHVTNIGTLPVTEPHRTVIDLAAVVGRVRLDQIIDNALAAKLINLDRLSELFSDLARRGKPGVAKLRRVLEARSVGYVAPESELERRLISLLQRAGLPEPIRQFSAPWLVETDGRVDLAYPDEKLIIEADGRRWHTMEKAFDSDRERDRKAQLAGWRVLRFTWEDVVKQPILVVSQTRSALSRQT